MIDLEARGIRLSVDGDRLEVDAPVGVLTPELLQRLREAKDDLMQVLTSSGLEVQLDMLPARFARSGRCQEVYSRVLGEKILIAADNAELPEVELVAYRAAELGCMASQSANELRAIHAVRKAIDGEMLKNGYGGIDVPAALLLPGVTTDFHCDIANVGDDGELGRSADTVESAAAPYTERRPT